jgi:polygalacturonase
MRRIYGLLLVLAVLVLLRPCFGGESATQPAAGWPEVAMPRIPEHTFVITDFGAVADGKTLATDAIRKTVAACEKAGGGAVVVPPGEFLTGPVSLGSDLELRVEKGATLRFSNARDDFPRHDRRFVDCINADDCHDVAITGAGTIDGQGAPWWEEFRKAKSAGDEAVLPHRPHLIVLSRCARVLVRDVQLANSPMFHLVPKWCRDVAIDGVRITAPEHAPNTDGIDPSGINFRITRCTIDVGDDCIAVKGTGITEAGHPACENFLISDCTFLHGHGMSIGGQTNDGVRHLTVRDCTFRGTQAGIRMKASRGAGGVVEDVTYTNLAMTDVATPILITSYYPKIPKEPAADPAEPVGKATPIWRGIRISNLTATGATAAGRMIGLPEMPISDVVLADVKISAERGMEVIHARGIRFERCTIETKSPPAVVSRDAEVQGIDARSE